MVVNKVLSRVLQVSYDVASEIRGAASLFTKHIRCPLDTNKADKHTGTVLQMDDTQKRQSSTARQAQYWTAATKYRDHPNHRVKCYIETRGLIFKR